MCEKKLNCVKIINESLVLFLHIAPACGAGRARSSSAGNDEGVGGVERERFSPDSTGDRQRSVYFPTQGSAGEFTQGCAGRCGIIFLTANLVNV